jgi:hypothetical protein
MIPLPFEFFVIAKRSSIADTNLKLLEMLLRHP